METLQIVYLLLFFCVHSVFCFPTKPLNERSTELAWQAWLLVDDQNQNKQYDAESLARRKITPKSVFIAPTFRPESLPACADGYREDVMRRCIKIIKLDEEAHLGFLEEKLIAQFGSEVGESDEDDVGEEELPNPGPFHINFPLGGEETVKDTESKDDDVDIAIVITPTNSNINLTPDHFQKKKSPEDQPLDETYGMREEHQTPNKPPQDISNEKTTTLNPITTTQVPSTDSLLSTEIVEISTEPLPTESIDATTLSMPEETTSAPERALFFLQPLSTNNTKHVQNGSTNNNEDTPSPSPSLDKIANNTNHGLTTLLSNSTFIIDASININKRHHLPIDLQQKHKNDVPDHPNSDDLETSENIRISDRVRFPTDEEIPYYAKPVKKSPGVVVPYLTTYASQYLHKLPSQNLDPSSVVGDLKALPIPFGSHLENRPITRNVHTSNENVENLSGSGDQSLVSDLKDLKSSHALNREAIFNRRNRDKHSSMWSFPPSLVNSSLQKPIVLRFPGRSATSRYLIEEHLKPHNSEAFYREFPKEDFSYIFGIDQNRRTTR